MLGEEEPQELCRDVRQFRVLDMLPDPLHLFMLELEESTAFGVQP